MITQEDVYSSIGLAPKLTPASIPSGAFSRFLTAVGTGVVNVTIWGDSNSEPLNNVYSPEHNDIWLEGVISNTLRAAFPNVTFNVFNRAIGGTYIYDATHLDDSELDYDYGWNEWKGWMWTDYIAETSPHLVFCTWGTNITGNQTHVNGLLEIKTFLDSLPTNPSIVFGTPILGNLSSGFLTPSSYSLVLQNAASTRNFASANGHSCLDLSRHEEFLLRGVDVLGINQQTPAMITSEQFYGDPNQVADAKSPWGGNGINHPSAVGWSLTSYPEMIKIKNSLTGLAAPSNLGIYGNKLFWFGVQGASSYRIYLNGVRWPSVNDEFYGTFSDLVTDTPQEIIGDITVSAVIGGVESNASPQLPVNLISNALAKNPIFRGDGSRAGNILKGDGSKGGIVMKNNGGTWSPN